MKPHVQADSAHRRQRAMGFTLIELMITVAIVAILTAIAYPSYRNYVIRGQLVDATNNLSALHANMERYFQDNRTYMVANPYFPPCTPNGAANYVIGNFTYSCSAPPTATTYKVQAAGNVGGPTDGFTFYEDNFNVQSSAVAAPAPSAWIISCPSSWVSKAGSC